MKGKPLVMTAITVVMLLFVTSCEKERGGLYQGGDGGFTNGKMLAKVSYYDYYKHYENNSLKRTSGDFEWNGFKWIDNNLSGIVDGEYEGNMPIEEDLGYDFIYNGNTLIEITQEKDNYQSNHYFTYSNGHVGEIYSTYIEGTHSGWEKRQFTYYGNGQLQSLTKTQDDGDIYIYNFVWTGDNITTIQRIRNGNPEVTTNYTYDSKMSAYSSMPEIIALWADGFEWLSANNVIFKTKQYSDGDYFSYSYTYIYDGDYPVKRVYCDNPDYSSYYSENVYTEYYEYSDGTGMSQRPQVYCVKGQANNSNYGYVYGSGEYLAGAMAVLNAESYGSYNFQSWSDGNTQNPRTITVNNNSNYTAIFGNGSSGNGTYQITFNGSSWYPALTVFLNYTINNGYMTILAYKNSADVESGYYPTNDVLVYGWLASSAGTYTSSTGDFMYYWDPNQIFTLNSQHILTNGDTIAAGSYYRYSPIISTFTETITAIDLNALTISATWSEQLYDAEFYINNNGNNYGTTYTLSGTLSNYHFSWNESKDNGVTSAGQSKVIVSSTNTTYANRSQRVFKHQRNHTED